MKCAVLVFLLAVGCGAGHARAQSLEGVPGGRGAYFTFFDPGDITMEVKVWGAVSSPGLYEVSQGMTLSTLLTLAGGPSTAVRTNQTRTTLTVRLLRPGAAGRYDTVFSSVMQDEILIFDPDPVVIHGDMLVVEETVKQRTGWRDVLSVASVVTSLTALIIQIARN